ncbi:MAG: DUF692 family protein [Gammaproteobacteria bacterium]
MLPSQQIQGIGLGLRACHYAEILAHRPSVPWFEAISENYLPNSPILRQSLIAIRQFYPMVLHGVGLSLGSTDPLNWHYLRQLKALAQCIHPAWISDHLSWTSFQGQYFHELLPLPYTEEAIAHVVSRIQQVQDFLGQQILIENVSSYLSYTDSGMPEWEFINAIAQQADCFILLDINNIYVSGHNHGFNPEHYLLSIDRSRVKQLHLAGFQDCQTHLLDTHGTAVAQPVWDLYQKAKQYLGDIPAAIEWDNAIPAFSELELERAKAYQAVPHSYSPEMSCISAESDSASFQPCYTLHHTEALIAAALNQQTSLPEDMVKSIPPLDTTTRLTIYRHSFTTALAQSLSHIFTVCQQVVGESFFGHMALAYVAKTPSTSPDIEEYGLDFADFIQCYEPAASLPYLPDLARLEWAWHKALRSPNYSPLSVHALQSIPDTQHAHVVFKLPPGSTLLRSPYPLLKIWQVHQDGSIHSAEDAMVDLTEGGVNLWIWREADRVCMQSLDEAHWQLLSAIAQDLSLAEIFALSTVTKAEQLLPELFAQGWLAGVEVPQQIRPVEAVVSPVGTP